MSKLNVDQKTIYDLFSYKKSDFLIPDYQRPYAWTEENCQTLWDDIFTFAFPNYDSDQFDDNEEYFLGSIVTFKNTTGQLEVIDGQQRLTTLMLLLRAFYDMFANMNDQNSVKTREMIEKCIWKTDTFGNADKESLKLNSEVATDDDKEEFLHLLKDGLKSSDNTKPKSKYAQNYQFFKEQIETFLRSFPSYFPYLPARILRNCILLPIEAESQDTALRIFSTLNDRGLPLSDADIFKAQLYKFYGDKGEKDIFIERWKNLEELTVNTFRFSSTNPMDELFTRYMYYLRSKNGNRNTTVEALRKFYEKNKYAVLKNLHTLDNLESLASFWFNIMNQDKTIFSEETLKKLYILHYAPNSMWQYITSVYFLHYKDKNNTLEEASFNAFLDKITAFIYGYAVTNPGVNALRTPLFEEMINIVNNQKVSFSHRLFTSYDKNKFENHQFNNQRPITRSLITWYAFTFEDQPLLSINEYFHLEHIFSKKRYQMDSTSLSDKKHLESLGNKILLEERINIKASDYRFEDKKKIYNNEVRRSKHQEKSQIAEIHQLVNKPDFTEQDIIDRTRTIIDTFFTFLEQENLLSSS